MEQMLNILKALGLDIHRCTDDECVAHRGNQEYKIRYTFGRLEVWRLDPDNTVMHEDIAERCADSDDPERCIEEEARSVLNRWNTREELVCNLEGRVKLFRRYAAVEGDYSIDVYRVLAAEGEIDLVALLPFMIEYA